MPMMMTVVMMMAVMTMAVMTMVAEAAPAVAVLPVVVEAQEEGVVAVVPGAEVVAPQEGSRAEVMEKDGMACLPLLPEPLIIENLNPERYCSLILKKTP